MKDAIDALMAALERLYEQAKKHPFDCECAECNTVWGELLHAEAALDRATAEEKHNA